jgi:hypothetical protein
MHPDHLLSIDDNVWPHFNCASFDQDKVVSFGDFQYTIFWAADQTLVLARRNLRTQALQTFRFSGYHLSLNPQDGHRNTVLGISPHDGRLHLSWDHHNNDLRYTKSHANFLTDPPDKITWADFEPAQPLTSNAPQRVTYPRFFNDHQDNLFFIYRTGSSGSGDSVLSKYDANSASWTITARCLFSKEGTYTPWENSTSRNAYLHDVLFDHTGRLHITWVYREAGRSWASNHDLHYAYSNDEGRTWQNNAGQPIADTSKNNPITHDDPGIIVQHIPTYSWLMNQCSMTLDANNQPHVATFHMAEPFLPEDLKHDPPDNVLNRLAIHHYWRTQEGEWHNSGPILQAPEQNERIKRPVIVADTQNNIVIYTASSKGHQCHVAFVKDHYQTRSTFQLTDASFNTTDASKHDRCLLKNEGILSFTADPSGDSEHRAIALVDFSMDRLLTEAEAHL